MRAGRQLSCDGGHSFDVARSGYISLLQPQDRRSSEPGDAKDAVAARARLLDTGVGRPVIDAIAALAPATSGTLVAADLGCGSGELLGTLASGRDVCGVGIDLSSAAASMAARRFPALTWVVANADRRLPLLDASVHAVLSLNGRRNPVECARVLVTGGALIIALPAPDDLIELRAFLHGSGVARDRADAAVAAHAPHFALVDRIAVRERHSLGVERLRDLLRGTYRGARLSAAARVETLDSLDVTLSTDVLALQRLS